MNAIAVATASGGAPPYIFEWNTNPIQFNDTAFISTPGTYIVAITDANNCRAVDTVIIPDPNSDLMVTIDNITPATCFGTNTGAIDISVSGGSGSYTYLWVPGNFITEDIANIDAGLYQVTITDPNNCIQAQVVVSQPPRVPAYAGRDTAICAGSRIQLDADAVPFGAVGKWSSTSIPDSLFSNINDTDAVVSNTPSGNNTITWTVTDANGCISSDDVILFNFNLSAGSDFSQCDLTPIQLNATIIPGLTGVWTASSNVGFNDPMLNNAIATLVNYGIDTLVWTVSGIACNSSDVAVIAAYQSPGSEAGDSQTVCSSKAKLFAIVTGPGSGLWSVRSPSQAVIVDPISPQTDVENLNTGISVFVWTMTNGVCSAIDTVIVNYDQSCDLELPSGFTPNDDGFNDGYLIKGIDGYPNNYFTVFNRWGNEVYSIENYINTDWRGQDKKGEKLPEGTYYVILQIKNSDIKKNTFVDLRRYSPNK